MSALDELRAELQWADDTGLGHQTYYNVTQQRKMMVFAQNHWVSPQSLRQQLLIR